MCAIATKTKWLYTGNVNEKRRIVQGSGSIVRLEQSPLDISPAIRNLTSDFYFLRLLSC